MADISKRQADDASTETNQREKVVFYFPWKEISGGPKYLSNLANDLADDQRYEVLYVDYEPGLSDSLLNKNVKKIPYSEPFTLPIQSPVTLIVPVYCAMFIPRLHWESKIIFINWHNYCTQALLDVWRLPDRQLQIFLKMIYDHDAMFFLDRTHWLAQNEWIAPEEHYSFPEKYVPITTAVSSISSRDELVCDNEIHIAVLGRLCQDKIYSLINLLEQLESVDLPFDKHVHVIGDGQYKDLLTERQWGNGVYLHLEGTITGDDLKEFLAEKVDVLFAMGTSVLEGASVGLPSVIMPHNVHPFSLDAYAYLHESKGYALGWYDTQITRMEIPMRLLSEVLIDIYQNGQKKILGQQAKAYLENHHLSNVELLKVALSESKLTYQRFYKFFRRQGYLRLLGIPIAKITSSFDGSSKLVSLFGIQNGFEYRIDRGKKEFLLFGKVQKWIIAVKDGEKFRIYIRIPLLRI